ncbi:LAETG motif-containing sortase-dependent surface protein [Streptomyces sp. NPDC058000]|uniref:LAETG motif-containing sortase-dependent surface protein n=1 Tax=Streptomyces sp. NPDC058000 TaxID=3346299 RepID=UPI0036F16E2D
MPLRGSAPQGGVKETSAKGNLAETGSSSALPTIALVGGVAMAAGAGAIISVRRRKATAGAGGGTGAASQGPVCLARRRSGVRPLRPFGIDTPKIMSVCLVLFRGACLNWHPLTKADSHETQQARHRLVTRRRHRPRGHPRDGPGVGRGDTGYRDPLVRLR